jgi:redox-sensitive bicupin YhaK (pirin superfamily)
MMTIRRAEDRGHADHGWLDSHHSFSFADYYDPEQMGYRVLRVLNEDRVAGGGGFPPHQHRDMEIISYVLDGELAHKDSLGNGEVIRPHDVQRMSAGTGVTHSEFNASPDKPVHFLQIWILPEKNGQAPGYEQKHFPVAEKRDRLRLVASPNGAEGSVTLRQDARIYASIVSPGAKLRHELAAKRHAYVHVARGELKLGDATLRSGDAARLAGPTTIELTGVGEDTDVLVFDLP